MIHKSHSSKEDVLDAFAAEPDLGRSTLERYLHDYPGYAENIVDLAAELTRSDVEEPVDLLPEEIALIDSGWQRYANAGGKVSVNPFAGISAGKLKEVAEVLGIKRSVLTAFRECTVIAASVPGRFMRLLAEAIECKEDVLNQHLMRPAAVGPGRSFKSATKPQPSKAVTFEQLLIDAGMPEGDRKRFLTED